MTSNILENFINWLQYRKNRREFMGNLSRNLFYLDDSRNERVDFFGGIFRVESRKNALNFYKSFFKVSSQFPWIFSDSKNPNIFFIKYSNLLMTLHWKYLAAKNNENFFFLSLSPNFLSKDQNCDSWEKSGIKSFEIK